MIEALREVSIGARTLKRDQEPARRHAARSRSCAARARRSSPGRPWSSTEASTSIEALAHRARRRRARRRPQPDRLRHRRRRGASHRRPVAGRALVWELSEEEPDGALLSAEVDLDPSTEWLMRCDRVDFEPGRHRLPPHPSRAGHPLPAVRVDHDRLARAREHAYGPGRAVVRARARPGAGDDGGGRAVGVRAGDAAAGRVRRASGRSATSTRPTPRSPRRSARRSSWSSRWQTVSAQRRPGAGRPARRCTGPTSRSACRARATSPCSTRCTTRRCG